MDHRNGQRQTKSKVRRQPARVCVCIYVYGTCTCIIMKITMYMDIYAYMLASAHHGEGYEDFGREEI